MSFQAVLLEQVDGKTVARVAELSETDLPAGEVLVDVEWSTLNYKDGLAITGLGKIVRSFPFVPGIDFAGTVAESASPRWKPGDRVVLTGWGVGERSWGGLAQKARVQADWLVALPDGLTPKRAMALGTAGFTAMLAVQMLEKQDVHPDSGEIVVTGAGGGVGSIAVALLAKAGYRVIAATGRAELAPWLTSLGATQVIGREELLQPSKAPLDSARFAGAIDNVGGETLAGLLRAMKQHGTVCSVGLTGGHALHTTVYPFILRGVRLIGIDSVYVPTAPREAAWLRLSRDLSPELLDGVTQTIPLGAVIDQARAICEGRVKGRLVVDLHA